MSGYRDDKKLIEVDPFTWGYQSARIGFGLVASSLGLLVMGHLISAAVIAMIGTPLLRYGLRNS